MCLQNSVWFSLGDAWSEDNYYFCSNSSASCLCQSVAHVTSFYMCVLYGRKIERKCVCMFHTEHWMHFPWRWSMWCLCLWVNVQALSVGEGHRHTDTHTQSSAFSHIWNLSSLSHWLQGWMDDFHQRQENDSLQHRWLPPCWTEPFGSTIKSHKRFDIKINQIAATSRL